MTQYCTNRPCRASGAKSRRWKSTSKPTQHGSTWSHRGSPPPTVELSTRSTASTIQRMSTLPRSRLPTDTCSGCVQGRGTREPTSPSPRAPNSSIAYVFAHDAQPLGSASGLGLAEHRCIKLRLRRNDRECYMCSSVPRQYSWIVQLYSFTSETSNRYIILLLCILDYSSSTSTTRTVVLRVVLVRVRPTKKAMTEPRRRSTVSVCTVRCESQNNTTIVLFVARRIRSRTSSRQTLVLILYIKVYLELQSTSASTLVVD